MTPFMIIQDLVKVAQFIHEQVVLVKSNQDDANNLAQTIQRLVSSLNNLERLPDNVHFIQNLKALQSCIHEAYTFLGILTKKSYLEQLAKGRQNAAKIDGFRKQITDLVPLLNVGLSAQQLINQDAIRLAKISDEQRLLEQERNHFQQLQVLQQQARLEHFELIDIVRRQMASMERRLKAAPTDFSEEDTIGFHELSFRHKITETPLGRFYHGTWQENPVTIQWHSSEAHVKETAKDFRKLRHEHLAAFYGVCMEEGQACLVMSPITCLLPEALPTLDASQRLNIAKDLASGLLYLHERKQCHGAICPEHIALYQGQAKWFPARFNTPYQDLTWQAPECLTHSSTSGDIYSFSLILWYLITGFAPYQMLAQQERHTRLLSGFRETPPDGCPEAMATLIQTCWSPNHLDRPTAKALIQHLNALTPHDLQRAPSPTGEMLYAQGMEAQEAGNWSQATHCFSRARDKGYARAYTHLGLFKLEGKGEQSVNKEEAIRYLEKAGELGHARALYNLGKLYEKGDTPDGKLNYTKALDAYQKALNLEPENLRYQQKVKQLSELLQPDSSYHYASRQGKK